MNDLDIGVVGCGYAGGAAALFLARLGHALTVYETVEKPGPVGAGILLQPTGMVALEQLGLRHSVLARGAPVERLRARTSRGRAVIDLRYADLARGLFGAGLHRGALFETLFGEVVAHPAIDLRCGVDVRRLERTGDGRLQVCDGGGRVGGPHDLVVVADGARSSVQVPDAPKRRVDEYPWGALWAVLEDPEEVFAGELHQVVAGTHTMLGFMPTGTGPRSLRRDVPLVSVFWSVHRDRVNALRSRGLHQWRAGVLALEPRAEAVLGTVDDMDALPFATYRDVRMKRFHTDRVVYIGDAAHAMSPQLGQGANLAIFDAAVLGDCLAAAGDVSAALAEYTRKRRNHLGYYQWATRWLTPFFQSDARPLGWLRDTFMGTASRLPWLRTQMIASMAGVQVGLFRRMQPVLEQALPERADVR